jgi:hypothetical protein
VNYSFYDFLGTIGVVLIVLMYLLLQLSRIKSNSLFYSSLNALGAMLIIISLIFEFNISAFIIESFWLLISLYGIIKFFIDKNKSG